MALLRWFSLAAQDRDDYILSSPGYKRQTLAPSPTPPGRSFRRTNL